MATRTRKTARKVARKTRAGARLARRPRDLLSEVLLPRLKSSAKGEVIARIGDEKDLARVAAWLQPLLEASPSLGQMFLADSEQFCRDLGIELSPTIVDHYRQNVPFYQRRDPKLYQALKAGQKPAVGVDRLRFNLSPEIRQHAPALDLDALAKLKPGQLTWAQSARLFAPRPPAASRRARSAARAPIGVGAPGQVAQALTTAGWNVAVQVEETFFAELYDLFFSLNFLLSDLAAIFSGGISQTSGVDRQYRFVGWFLAWFEVRFAIANPPRPRFVLDNGAPKQMRLDLDLSGTIALGDSPDSFDPGVPFTATASQRGQLAPRASGQFAGGDLENYYAAVMNGETLVELGEGPDTLKELFVTAAVHNYFANELPELFILPTPHTPPFITFDQSDIFVVDDGQRQAITLAFGPPAGAVEPFPEINLAPGRNITLAIHRGAVTQQIEQNLPDLPLEDGGTTIETIDIALRDGHLEVSGEGFVETCFCYPSIDFQYTARVELGIDAGGNLTASVTGTDVSSTWANVHAILTAIFGGPLGVVVGAVGWILFHAVLGTSAGAGVEEQLDVSQNFNEQFSREFTFGSVSADFDQVEVTRNGLFIHGQLAAELDLG